MVDICLLGCGGMMPLLNRRLTSALLRYKGKILLIDCGEGTQIGVRAAGWGFKSIDAILFTHYHGDHVAGLPGLLMTIGNSGREAPLTIIGPPMLCEIVRGLCVIVPELPFEIKLLELSVSIGENINLGEILIRSIPLEHSMPCLAYSIEIKRSAKFEIEKARQLGIPIEYWNRLQNGDAIEHDGRCFTPEKVLGSPRKGIKVTYCTDSRPVKGFADFAKGSDLLICEGIYGELDMRAKAIEKKHMIFSEAAELALDSGSKELWLTHFSPALKQPDEFIENATNIFRNTLIGRDGMTKTINFEKEI